MSWESDFLEKYYSEETGKFDPEMANLLACTFIDCTRKFQQFNFTLTDREGRKALIEFVCATLDASERLQAKARDKEDEAKIIVMHCLAQFVFSFFNDKELEKEGIHTCTIPSSNAQSESVH